MHWILICYLLIMILFPFTDWTYSLQRDEIDSLKAALERTLKAKNKDMKVYSTTLEETKRVFLQALRQLKGGQSISR